MKSTLKKYLLPIITGVLGIGGTTAVTKPEIIKDLISHNHSEVAPHNHDQGQVEVKREFKIDEVVYLCEVKA